MNCKVYFVPVFFRCLRALAFTVLLITGLSLNSTAQVTTNGGSGLAATYPSLASAITALNSASITAPVTITLTANQTAPAGGYDITAQGTSTNTITIDGGGFTVTAFTPQTSGNLNDALFKLTGADFVAIQNFVMQENSSNTTTTAASNNMTEWGVALLYSSTVNGASNNTIQNNTISLNRTYQNTWGIYSNSTHSATAVTTSATATGANGANHNLKIYGNNISNVNNGIFHMGPTAATDHADVIDIGGSSASTGNTITNYGNTGTFSTYNGVSQTVNGILVRNTRAFNIQYNTVTSSNTGGALTTSGTLRGIFVQSASNAPTGTNSQVISNNTISVTHGAAAGALQGIVVEGTTGTATTSLSINSNTFQNCGFNVASPTGSTTFINSGMANLNTTISNNVFNNLTIPSTGAVTFISNSIALPASGTQTVEGNSIATAFSKTGAGSGVTLFTATTASVGSATVIHRNNNFSNITLTGATTMNGWSSQDGGAVTKTFQNNTFQNITGGTGAMTIMNINQGTNGNFIQNNTINNITGQLTITGIQAGTGATTATVSGNTVTNLSSTGTGSSVTGIFCGTPTISCFNNTVGGLSSTGATNAVTGITTQAATASSLYRNKVYDLSSSAAGGSVTGISITGGATVNAYNNIIGNLTAPALNAANSLIGINVSGGTNVNLFYNTVYLNASSTGALFGSSAINASTTPTLTLRNNLFHNASGSNGTGLAVAYRRSSTTLTSYAAASNNNDFVASTIYNDGTTSYNWSGYQTLVATRDAASINWTPVYLSLSGTNANFLHIDPAAATQLESAAVNITSPSITDDFDAEIRQGNPGYSGTGTAPDIGADEFEGARPNLCAGVPTPGAATCTPATACVSGSTNLSVTNPNLSQGVTIQWYASTTPGGPYTLVAGAVTASVSSGTRTQTTYFVASFKCTATGDTVISNEVIFTILPAATITVSPASSNYCPSGGAAVNLTASGGSTYAWSPATGLSASTGTSVNASPSATSTYTVTGTNANGCTGTATAVVNVLTNTVSLTAAATPSTVCAGGNSNLSVTANTTQTQSFTGGGITLSSTATAPSNGSPYPSTINVSGIGVISSLKVTIANFSHTIPNEVDIVLFGPTGAHSIIFSDAVGGTGGNLSTSPRTYTFQNGATSLSTTGFPASGTYGPTNGGSFSGTGTPSAVTTTNLGVFNNTNANGDWRLYVYDDVASNGGSIGSWSIEFTYSAPISGTSYAWSPATFLNNPAVQNPTASSITSSTTYTVVATYPSGCSASSTVPVTAGVPLLASATPSAVCVGSSSTLTANVSGGAAPYTYNWSNGTNTIGTSSPLTTTPTAAGSYILTVTDACGATATATVAVNSIPTVSISGPASICAPTTVTLTASGAASYLWSTSQTINPITPSISATTSYTVTGTAASGCTATASFTVVRESLSITASSSPSSICSGGNSNLNATASTSTTQSFAGGSITIPTTLGNSSPYPSTINASGIGVISSLKVTIANFSHTWPSDVDVVLFGPTGAHSIIFTDAIGGSGGVTGITYTFQAGATVLPTTGFPASGTYSPINGGSFNGLGTPSAVTNSNLGVFNGTNADGAWSLYVYDDASSDGGSIGSWSIEFTYAAPVSGITYAWSPATFLNNTTVQNPTANSITGSTTYTVIATASSGCTASSTAAVSVIGLPTVAVTASPTTLCAGANLSLTSVVSGGSTPYSYSWSDGANVVSTTANATANPIASSTYTLTLTDACGSTRTATTARVNVNPTPGVTVSPGAATYCAPNAVALTASSGTAGSTFAWTPATGLSTTTGASVNASPASSTTYTVTATRSNGCTSTATVAIASGTPITVDATADTTQSCSPLGTVLHACVNPTGTYTLDSSNVSYSPTGPTTPLHGVNVDNAGAAVTLPFSFNFYGNTYTTASVSSNGYLLFGGTVAISATVNAGSAMPNTATNNNSISLVGCDLVTRTGSSVESFTVGAAPNRRFVVSYSNVRFLSDNPTTPASIVNGQIALHEGTGVIEIRVDSVNSGADTRNRTLGIENASGTAAVTAPGKNNSQWNSARTTYRFTPVRSCSNTGVSFAWTPSTGLNSPTSSDPTVTGLTATTLYTLTATNASGCSAQDTISLIVSASPQITGYSADSACVDAQITINGSNLIGVTSISFNGTAAATFTVVNDNTITVTVPTGATTGPVSVTNGATGCSSVGPVFTRKVQCGVSLSLKVFMEGYCLPSPFSGTMSAAWTNQLRSDLGNGNSGTPSGNEADLVMVELFDNTNTLRYSDSVMIMTDGTGTMSLPAPFNGNSYYILISHRSHASVRSAGMVAMSSNVSYDFTTSDSQADNNGSNTSMVQLSTGAWAMWVGDVTRDGFVGGDDVGQIDNDNINAVFLEYINTDVTGDGFVGGDDVGAADNNNINNIYYFYP